MANVGDMAQIYTFIFFFFSNKIFLEKLFTRNMKVNLFNLYIYFLFSYFYFQQSNEVLHLIGEKKIPHSIFSFLQPNKRGQDKTREYNFTEVKTLLLEVA